MIRHILTIGLAALLVASSPAIAANQLQTAPLLRAPQLAWVDVDLNHTRDELASVRMDLALAHDLDQLQSDARWLTLNHPRSAAGVQVAEVLRAELNGWATPASPALATRLHQLSGALAHQHAIYSRLEVLPKTGPSLAATHARITQLRKHPSPLAPPALVAHNQHLQLALGWPFTQALLVYGHELEEIAANAAKTGDDNLATQAMALADLVIEYSTLPV